ncbi:MAG TPA: nicotinate-nucleotide adenylyltransferase, partial [Geodermatophilus sp.]|nr:nicotinate-nucleotide adenylyltransferase [Geodermatophilus sp.]
IATASNPKFSVSRVDIDRTGPTYTIDTLCDLHQQYPDDELFFITGADALSQILSWRDSDRCFELAHFIGVTRPGFDLGASHLPEGAVSLVEVPALAISSSDCRDRVGRGMPVWYLVPDGVVQYIEKRGLYRSAAGGRRRARGRRPPRRCRRRPAVRGPPDVRPAARDGSRHRGPVSRTTDHRSPGGTPMTASSEARETALLAAQAAADKLATDVAIVDVSERLAITDAFVLASAPNERQVQAIVDEVEERLRQHGVKPVRREGVAEARWVLLDFVDVVVHVQHAEERAYYALERLWKDCPTIPFVDRAVPQGDGAAPGAATLSADDVDPASADPTPLAPGPGDGAPADSGPLPDEDPSGPEAAGR